MEIAKKLEQFPTAIIADAIGGFGCMSSAVKPVVDTMKVAASAYTVQCFAHDNLMAHYAIKHAPKGCILVISTNGDTEGAYWGELMTLMALKKGISGVVTDGGIRDKAIIAELGFPVFASSSIPAKTSKVTNGDVSCRICCGGVAVHPGDIIAGDADGVVVVSPEKFDTIYNLAKANHEREEYLRERIAAGELLFDILGMDKLISE